MSRAQLIFEAVMSSAHDIGVFNDGMKIDDVLMHEMSNATVSLVKSRVADLGFRIDDIKWDLMKWERDPDDHNAVALRLPISLELAMLEDAPDVQRFDHDCVACIFLAHAKGHDLYFCGEHHMGPTVIARYSSLPSKYMSGIRIAEAAMDTTPTHPLVIALKLAREKTLI